jgi:putative tricarboxylic transport membrane protein
MFDAFLQGAVTVFQPMVFLSILLGVALGVSVGVTAIGGMVACALFLPFVYQLPPELALSFLVALTSVVFTGGSITSVLLGVPGTAPNAATVIDGFPMAQKGEAGRALGAAIGSSMFGAIASVFMAMGMIPILKPIVLSFRAPEMFMVILLGLAFLAIMAAGSPVKGMISGLFGVLLALIGFQGVSGVYRYTFGSFFLSDGFDLNAVVLGIFALTEMFDMIVKGKKTVAMEVRKVGLKQVFQGVKDIWIHKWLFLRCSVIGYVVGIVPAIGGNAAMFIAYGHAKQSSKNSKEFGTGRVEGVIGPESANNASAAGDLLTTMAFGIPGSAVMALLMGGFLLVGVTPGPVMIKDSLPLVFTLLVGIGVANALAGIICLLVAPQLTRVSFIRIDYLFVVITAVVFIGAFIGKLSLLNLLVAILFGVLGYIMKRFGYSRESLILGLVLGELFEFYLIRALKIFGPTFFMTPTSLVILIFIIAVFVYPWLKNTFNRRSQKTAIL